VPNQGAVITGNPYASPLVTVLFYINNDGFPLLYQITQQVGLNASGVGTIWVSPDATATLEDENINGYLACTAAYGTQPIIP
jgi:hypothetical protein